MSKKTKDIGTELVSHSQEEHTAKHGLADELFPYIWVASKKMTTRSISAWLKDKHNLSLSQSTVSRVLREADDRIQKHYLSIRKKEHELYCLLPHDQELPENGVWCSALFNFPLFENHMRTSPYSKNEYDAEIDTAPVRAQIARLYHTIHEEWFSLPKEFRDECRKYASPFDLESEVKS